MKRRLLFLISLAGLCGCDLQRRDGESDIPPIETPPSYLGFRISFPASELEAGVNRVLPDVLFDDAVALKEDKDTLFLKIVRKGALELQIEDNKLLTSIPLEVTAAIQKKVMGITFSNESAPISFSGTMTASAQVAITENWDLDAICRFEEFDLGDSPKITLMGMSFNVGKTISNALDKNRDQISDLLCSALNNAIDFRSTIEEIWKDLQQPQRIASNPENLYLFSEPIGLNGTLQPLTNNELAIHLEYRTKLRISPEKSAISTFVPLGKQGEPLNDQPKLVAYPEVKLPFKALTHQLKSNITGMSFSYEGYQIEITDAIVGRDGQKVQIKLTTKGDLNGVVTVTGKPFLSANKELTLEDFSYAIDSDNDLVNATDWAVHLFAEQYLADQLRMDAKPVLESLDQIISDGIASSAVGSKMALDIDFQDISSYKIRLTDDYIQWVFYVQGTSELTLKRGLFK